MITNSRLNADEKIKAQQEIITQFENNKKHLLQIIDSLSFEKEFDREHNSKSIALAKSLIESIETQKDILAESIEELEQYKKDYRNCMDIMNDTMSNYKMTIDGMIDAMTTTIKPPRTLRGKIKNMIKHI